MDGKTSSYAFAAEGGKMTKEQRTEAINTAFDGMLTCEDRFAETDKTIYKMLYHIWRILWLMLTEKN